MANSIDIDTNLTVEQKMARCMLKLRSIRPYYSAIYESMEKKEYDIETIGVTTNQLLYNREFIADTAFSELMFINLHEIAHIALMHVARREGRDPELWNTACDLYVNASLLEEFNLEIGKVTTIDGFVDICAPYNGLYCSSIDTKTDYVEKIYANLEKQAIENGYFDNRISSSDENKQYNFRYTGSKKKQDHYYGAKAKEVERCWELSIDITVNSTQCDLIDTGEEQVIKEQSSKKLLSDADVRAKMSQSKAKGNDSSNIELLSKKLLKSEVDWRSLLNKYLTTAYSKDSSFNFPDKRMYYQKAIYPGQRSEDNSVLAGLKVCIDTSGSISDNDLFRFFYQIDKLAKQFKIEAELIYWDAQVKSVGSFSNIKEFERINCIGRGGTDPKCVFQRFISRKEKPVVVLMLTDGIWDTNWVTSKIKSKFRNTIWVLTKDYIDDFKAPFGKKATIKYGVNGGRK